MLHNWKKEHSMKSKTIFFQFKVPVFFFEESQSLMLHFISILDSLITIKKFFFFQSYFLIYFRNTHHDDEINGVFLLVAKLWNKMGKNYINYSDYLSFFLLLVFYVQHVERNMRKLQAIEWSIIDKFSLFNSPNENYLTINVKNLQQKAKLYQIFLSSIMFHEKKILFEKIFCFFSVIDSYKARKFFLNVKFSSRWTWLSESCENKTEAKAF